MIYFIVMLVLSVTANAAIGLIYAWINARTDRTVRPENGEFVVRYSVAGRAFSIALLVLPQLGLLLLALTVPIGEGKRWIPMAMSGGFLALGMPVAVEFFGLQHRVSAEGLRRGSPWRFDPLWMPWHSVQSLRFSSTFQGFVLENRTDKVIRVPTFGGVSGIGDFVRLALENVEEEKIDPAARKLLELFRAP
jgi:hypothetical protein